MPGPETSPDGYAYGDPRMVRWLVLRDGPACFYCGRVFAATMDGWSHMAVDHVIPQNKRDQFPDVDQPHNLRLTCKECNSAKRDRLFTPEQLAAFRIRRRLKRERDDQWVRWHRQFLEELRNSPGSCGLPDPGDLADRLCTELKRSEVTSDARRYTRTTSTVWVLFHREAPQNGKPYEWYFCTDHYQLQPHSLGWSADSLAPIDDFDLMGYFQDEQRCKYVEPFTDAARGVAIIAREVRAFEAMQALQLRLQRVKEATPQ